MTQDMYVPVFVDAKPSENLEPSTKQTLCFVAILTSNMEGIPKLKGYKNTKSTKKIDSAKKIISHLNRNELIVDAIGIVSRTDGQFIHWACDSINRARDMLKAKWEVEDKVPTYLIWQGKRIPRSTVMGLSIYASIMPIIALRAVFFAKKDPTRSFKLCLDALPNNSKLGMELMKAMNKEEEIALMWEQNVELGARFEIGTLDKWKGKDNKWHPGKKHPNSILVDWMAVGCLAKVNQGQLKAEGNYTSQEIFQLANIWESASTKSIFDLDDKEFMKKVKSHWDSKNKK